MKRKIKVIVVSDTEEQSQEYMQLFSYMLSGKIRQLKDVRHEKIIETGDFRIRFINAISIENLKGIRSDYVLNLSRKNHQKVDIFAGRTTQVSPSAISFNSLIKSLI